MSTRQQRRDDATLQRGVIEESVTALEEELTTTITNNNKPSMRQVLGQLTELWRRMDENSTAYYEVLSTTEEKKAETKYIIDFRSAAIRNRIKAEEAIAAGEPVQPKHNAGAQAVVKLPQLSLKKFKGKSPQEWGPWWSQFKSSVHDNPRLDKVQKFNYLVDCLEDDAAANIGGFSVEEAFYDEAINKTKERFERGAATQSSHFAALSRIQGVTERGNIVELRRFYDEVTNRVRTLKGLGVAEASYKDILKPILLVKIPSGMSVDWHRQENHDAKDVTALLKFIQEELESREDYEMLRREHRAAQPPKQNKTEKPEQNRNQGTPNQYQPSRDYGSGRPGTATVLSTGFAQPNQFGGRGRGRGFKRVQQEGQTQQYYQSPAQQTGQTLFNSKARYPCVFCKGNGHFPVQCSMPIGARWQLVMRERRCHVCLRDDHTKADCSNKRACRECPGAHHTALHYDKQTESTGAQGDSSQGRVDSATYTRAPPTHQPNPSTVTRKTALSARVETVEPDEEADAVLLSTATAFVNSPKGPDEAFIVFDSCSQGTFIRKEFAEQSEIPACGSKYLAVQPFGSPTPNQPKNQLKRKFNLISNQPGAKSISLTAVDDDNISPAPDYVRTKFAQELLNNGYYLADNRFFDKNPRRRPIDILIGMDQYWKFVGDENIYSQCGLTAVPSALGWLINGPAKEKSKQQSTNCHVVLINSMQLPELDQPDWSKEENSPPAELTAEALESNIVTMLSAIESKEGWDVSVDYDLQNFWNLEGQGVNDKCGGVGESDPLAGYSDSIQRQEDGSFVAPLPWMGNKLKLEKHFELNLGRLQSLLNRLRKTPELMEAYHKQILENVERGYVEIADPSYHGICTYLPHHPVIKPERTTTKIRPVFDGSARTKSSPSLNQCLYTGPNNTPDLLAVLLRFRIPKVVWIADIEKAFHQARLAQEDSEVIRFLWFQDPADPNSPVIHYVWKRLPFGLVCSPFILRAVIDKLLDFYANVYPETVQVIRDQLYVDDGLGGAEETKVTKKTIEEIRIIFSSANMKMRKWLSNDPSIRSLYGDPTAPTEAEGVISQGLSGNASPKVLGLTWDASGDEFHFNPEKIILAAAAIRGTPTKRQVAQISARIFDPMGFLAPVTVVAKMLFQKIWISKIDWDQTVTPDIEKDCIEFVVGLKSLSSLKIPRRAVAEAGRAASAELHVFCDASMKAIGAVAYLRTASREGQIQTTMLTARTRVAPPPPKSITMPRLELLAAHLGASLFKYISKTLRNIRIKPVLWSDSTITVAWIKGNKQRKVFVQNRINDIIKCTSPSWWRHCPGEDNPADVASRGPSGEALVSMEMWWKGPKWLELSEEKWPVSPVAPTEEVLREAEVEAEKNFAPRKPKIVLCNYAGPPLPPPVSELALATFPKRFSSLEKLCRHTAWALRVLRGMRF